MVVRIVEIDDVDPVEAKAFQALRERASNPVAGEVPAAAVGCGNDEAVVVETRHDVQRIERTADLGREHVRIARPLGKRGPQPSLGEAKPVVRGGVEVPYAVVPRCIDGRACVIVRDFDEEVSELRAAERQTAELEHQRLTRAPAPPTSARTSSSVAVDVSPGVVMASAPCAAPHSTASSSAMSESSA